MPLYECTLDGPENRIRIDFDGEPQALDYVNINSELYQVVGRFWRLTEREVDAPLLKPGSPSLEAVSGKHVRRQHQFFLALKKHPVVPTGPGQ